MSGFDYFSHEIIWICKLHKLLIDVRLDLTGDMSCCEILTKIFCSTIFCHIALALIFLFYFITFFSRFFLF